MTVLSDLIGASVDLETYAPEILGDKFRRCKILAILDYEDANRYTKANTLHATLLPKLPKGTTTDYTELKYLKIKLNNGETTALAVDWVILDNISKVDTYRRVTIKLDSVSLEEENRLRKLLISNDFVVIEIKETM